MAGSPLDAAAVVAGTMTVSSRVLRDATKKALRSVGNDARKTMRAQAVLVPGGDRRFSNMSGYSHGGRLDVKIKQRDGSVLVMSKGPWKIAEVGANPHRIGRGRHPGTRSSQGRRSWTKGQEAVFSDAERTVPKDIGGAVEKAFGG